MLQGGAAAVTAAEREAEAAQQPQAAEAPPPDAELTGADLLAMAQVALEVSHLWHQKHHAPLCFDRIAACISQQHRVWWQHWPSKGHGSAS